MRMCQIRFAERKDIPVILGFIRKLAEYEKLENEVVATESLLETWLFEKKKAEVLLALEGTQPVGYALFFVLPEKRGKGYGKALLTYLARLTVERGCGRLEWSCLDWNKSSMDFYLALGAKRMTGWTTLRLTGDDLNRAARGE